MVVVVVVVVVELSVVAVVAMEFSELQEMMLKLTNKIKISNIKCFIIILICVF